MSIKYIISSTGPTLLIISTFAFSPISAFAADTDFTDRSKAIAVDAKELAVEVGQSVAVGAETAWKDIDEQGLANRTRDDIVAWIIMGALVGAIAGMLASIRSTGFGRLGRLLLGLIGAFIGGLAVRIGQLDFGWNPVVIRYEELIFSFAGAVLLIVMVRLTRATTRKKHA